VIDWGPVPADGQQADEAEKTGQPIAPEKWDTHVTYTELVLFDDASILPRFIVRMQKTQPQAQAQA
jgi:hypothetical protein